MSVSLIVTVKNETLALPRLLDSLSAQTRPPDEIVIVDGGSTDGTLEHLRARAASLPLKIISLPGLNISQGRNAAIRAATGDIICATDAGVWLDPHWVEELVKPFNTNQSKDESRTLRVNAPREKDSSSFTRSVHAERSSFDVVSGFFAPDPHGAFETALAATTLPALADIRPAQFQPSSRSIAFRKRAWEKVNGYPEWLDYCEDLIFDFALRDAGFIFAFAPRAIANFRPRSSLPAFFKQYYQYARGDGKAHLFLKRHLIRYTTYLIAFPALMLWTVIAPGWALPLWLLAAAFMFFTAYRRLLPKLDPLSPLERIRALAWVPVIRVTGDVAKMLGYPIGVQWRAKNKKG
jgi:glycosyltransferase involved in cell wall biosynthesis